MPQATIAGRALVAVVAIMTFLASLTTGAVMLVRAAANEWQSDVGARGHDPDSPRRRPRHRGRRRQGRRDRPHHSAGMVEVRPYSKEETARLLEPWLGTGLRLDDLPVPRLIVVRIASGTPTRPGATARRA